MFWKKKPSLADAQRQQKIDDALSNIADAVSKLLALQMVATGGRSLEDAAGHINRKAIGYIYGFIDCALQSGGLDMADISIGIPVTDHVMRHLFPGREQAYVTFLIHHLTDEGVLLGITAGGQQYTDFIVKPGAKGAPMGLARFIVEEEARQR